VTCNSYEGHICYENVRELSILFCLTDSWLEVSVFSELTETGHFDIGFLGSALFF
jgi:hypothetical protein